jgi:hypothetical protein
LVPDQPEAAQRGHADTDTSADDAGSHESSIDAMGVEDLVNLALKGDGHASPSGQETADDYR